MKSLDIIVTFAGRRLALISLWPTSGGRCEEGNIYLFLALGAYRTQALTGQCPCAWGRGQTPSLIRFVLCVLSFSHLSTYFSFQAAC